MDEVSEEIEDTAGTEPEAEAPEVEASAEAASEPAEAEAAAEAPAESETAEAASEPAGGAAEQAAAPVAEPKKKKKRLPRALRKPLSKPAREKPAERKPITRQAKPEHERGRRQERQGTVVSDAMDKTIVVKVDVIRAHPKYRKVVRRSVKFHAHDEENAAKVGDVVRNVETRPLSATKRWRLAEILEAAK
jgi:small subunit ribosomal protein S17